MGDWDFMDEVKYWVWYLFATATGLISTGMVIGAFQYLFTGEQLLFTVMLGAWLVSRSNLENSNIVVIDKEQFQKDYGSQDDE